ncbi:ALPHA ALPHA TREHALASE PRECURSOR [Encephalitozoon cuniculi GB-M1]|uniref:Trehalase n=1 Tax=Encephalitozoon cuniculi (strain GB-M1) TaxID=284813 RepID=Q8SQJ2_ENCCU|nr:alpha alpha trehalase precursor [Encephalitozoon cuniculi GB-M1]CAD25166.3 ALPHA ALPHA TREHALASE PRECURSOR [Encephalitozoon cuniculi GB-M1]
MNFTWWMRWTLVPLTIHAAKRPSKMPRMDTNPCVSRKLLEAAFENKITKDSKYLVDKLFLKPPEEIDEMLRSMESEGKFFRSEEDFWNFVGMHSIEPGSEFIFAKDNEELEASMFSGVPEYVSRLEERLLEPNPQRESEGFKQSLETLVRVSKELNDAWKNLYVKQRDLDKGYYSTMIKVKNPFVIPGDRFKECYYWDTYWIIEGLVKSGMHKIAVGMVENFILLIEKYGFIPNGTRTYYLNRTQPPYFCMMLFTVYRHVPWTEEVEEIIKRGLKAAVMEYNFFMNYRKEEIEKDGKSYVLNVYRVSDCTPRAESYSEDRKVAENNKSKDEVYRRREEDIYSNLKAGAESGWDYSSRWLGVRGELDSIRTSKRVPADLNAIMYANELIIMKLFEVVEGKRSKNAEDFKKKSEERYRAINAVLWSDEEGVWNDYDIEKKKHTSPGFYFSNLAPMCYGISPPPDKNITVYDILNAFAEEIFGHPGGMPASGSKNKNSPEQWDYPNVWPPLVHIMTFFLERIGERQMALHLARSLLENISVSTSISDVTRRGIFEKYNCERVGDSGYKGEYAPQVGFGWTNGSAIHFLEHFSFELASTKSHAVSYQEIKDLMEKKVASREVPRKHTPENCLLLEDKLWDIESHSEGPNSSSGRPHPVVPTTV